MFKEQQQWSQFNKRDWDQHKVKQLKLTLAHLPNVGLFANCYIYHTHSKRVF